MKWRKIENFVTVKPCSVSFWRVPCSITFQCFRAPKECLWLRPKSIGTRLTVVRIDQRYTIRKPSGSFQVVFTLSMHPPLQNWETRRIRTSSAVDVSHTIIFYDKKCARSHDFLCSMSAHTFHTFNSRGSSICRGACEQMLSRRSCTCIFTMKRTQWKRKSLERAILVCWAVEWLGSKFIGYVIGEWRTFQPTTNASPPCRPSASHSHAVLRGECGGESMWFDFFFSFRFRCFSHIAWISYGVIGRNGRDITMLFAMPMLLFILSTSIMAALCRHSCFYMAPVYRLRERKLLAVHCRSLFCFLSSQLNQQGAMTLSDDFNEW